MLEHGGDEKSNRKEGRKRQRLSADNRKEILQKKRGFSKGKIERERKRVREKKE